MGKRYVWKTIHFRNNHDWRSFQSGVSGQENGAFKRWTIKMYSTGGGGGEVETNLPIAEIRRIARFAGVTINWKSGVLWDTQPSWEYPEEVDDREPQGYWS